MWSPPSAVKGTARRNELRIGGADTSTGIELIQHTQRAAPVDPRTFADATYPGRYGTESVHPISELFSAPVDVSHELSVCSPGCGEFFVAFLK